MPHLRLCRVAMEEYRTTAYSSVPFFCVSLRQASRFREVTQIWYENQSTHSSLQLWDISALSVSPSCYLDWPSVLVPLCFWRLFHSCLPLSCLSVSHPSSCCFLAAPTLPAHATPLCPDSAAPGATHPPFCPGLSQLPQVLPSHPPVCLAGTGNALIWHIKIVVTLTRSKMMAGRGQDRTQHIWYSKIVQKQFHVAKWNSTATRFIFFNFV